MIKASLCGVLLAVVAVYSAPAQAGPMGRLTDMPGDARRGQAILSDMSRASCLICHEIEGLDEKDQGQIGPPLRGIANVLSEAELRQRVVDARVMNPDTIMPPYFSLDNLFRVAEDHRGKTIYSAQDVEDVVAYLKTLKGK